MINEATEAERARPRQWKKNKNKKPRFQKFRIN